MPAISNPRIILLATTAIIALGQPCRAQTASGQNETAKSTVAAPAPDAAAKTDPDMAKVLAALRELNPQPIESLTPTEARRQPSAADAVKKVINDEKLDADPRKGLTVSNRHLAV